GRPASVDGQPGVLRLHGGRHDGRGAEHSFGVCLATRAGGMGDHPGGAVSGQSRPAFAASLNIAGANLGIGIGAFIGGRVIDHLGLGNVGFAAAGIIVLAIVLALLLIKRDPGPLAA
ncbi:major facilitator family transporter, partial [Pseudomonas syringae pv. actinidiae ICMP 19096]